MRAAAWVLTVILLWATVAHGSAPPAHPTRIVSIHYPCLALKARIQGKIRIRCAIGEDGACADVKIVYGHPLFYTAALENAKKWRFAPLKTASPSRTVDIDYRFEIRGVRVPEDQPDVEVTFELPHTVIVIAPLDDRAPCRMPPME